MGEEPRFLPQIPIKARGPSRAGDLLALVDSGAEYSVLAADLAEKLGISLEDAKPITIIGAGEHRVPGKLARIEFELGQHHWQTPIIFAQGMIRPILGHVGFFDFFTVTFRYDRREMDISWARGS